MRVIFMGTPDFAVPVLRQILEDGHEVVACYSQPPRPAGRGHQLRKSPVHLCAEQNDIPVFTPNNFKQSQDRELFAAHNADVGVVVAYGLLLPKPILDAPKFGCLNLHGSLLPRWRGAAPIQRAIMAGDEKTGVMVMQMDEGLDTGPVAMSAQVEIAPNVTAGELHDQMMEVGAQLMGQALATLATGDLQFEPQPAEGETYAKKILKSETRINWNQPASTVHNQIRALSPFPGAWCEINIQDAPIRVKILSTEILDNPDDHNAVPGTILPGELTIACADGAVRVLQVQRAGKSVMSTEQFLLGAGDLTGQTLASV